jgi:hypothetical protein
MKKRIVIVLLLSFLFNLVTFGDDIYIEGVNPDIDTDGSRSSVTWFRVFDNLLVDKVTNGVKFFLVLSSLRSPNLENDIDRVLESNTERKILLNKYGLRVDSIYFLMSYYMATFPEDMYDVRYNYVPGENIYADMYYDENFDYTKYMVRFYNYLNELFRQLPDEMKTIISKYDRLNAGEIVVMQGLMNVVIRDYIAFEVRNTINDGVVSQDLRLRNEIRQDLIDVLVSTANAYDEDYTGDTSVDMVEINEYVDAFMALGNVILESIELNLKSNNNHINYAMELARDANLLVSSTFTPSQDTIEITLSLDTDLIELDSSDPLPTGSFNSFQLTPTVGGTSNSVVYTIDDPSVASVDENGLVTLSTAKEGSATITATVSGFNVFKEVRVSVTEQTPLGAINFYGAYIAGYPDGTFKTDRLITRAEITAMIVRVLRLDVKPETNMTYKPGDFKSTSYSDVTKEHWAYTFLEIAKEEGLIGGYPGRLFKPDEPLSRAEMAVMFSNAWDLFNIEQEEFSKHFIQDIRPNHWAYDAINRVYNAKVVKGYEDGTFRPDQSTTRAEVVVMINKLINRKAFKPPVKSFEDVPIDHWAYGDVEAAIRIQEVREN